MAYAGVPIGVAVRPVGASGLLPRRPVEPCIRQVCAEEVRGEGMGAGQVRARKRYSSQVQIYGDPATRGGSRSGHSARPATVPPFCRDPHLPLP